MDEHNFGWEHAWRDHAGDARLHQPHAAAGGAGELAGRVVRPPAAAAFADHLSHQLGCICRRLRSAGHTDPDFLANISLVHENGAKCVRMAHLAFVGSHAVNGVSALHTDLLRKTLFHDLALSTPTRIVNKTNGITFRRWLIDANPPLTGLLTRTLGERVLDDPEALRELEAFADDAEFVAHYRNARAHNKAGLADLLHRRTGVRLSSDALFDVHIKRVHEYKRQLLNILEAIALYQAIRAEPDARWVPRVKIFAGKAAASYERAKLIIKLDQRRRRASSTPTRVVGDRLKIVFAPNYSVSLAEKIIPAADLSEQISTAGMEASGTGNMKLALNGALTIGTLDGANIEIREQVGAENVVIFGMTAAEVAERQRSAVHRRRSGGGLAAARSGAGGALPPARSRRTSRAAIAPIVDALLGYDHFMVAADFEAYWQAQREVDRLWQFGQRLVAQRACSTPRAWAGSPPTAPSANTPATSGTCRSPDRSAAGLREDFPYPPQIIVMFKLFERDRQPAPPVRMLVDGARNVDLIAQPEHVLDRQHRQPRRRGGEERGHRRDVVGRIGRRALGERLAQALLRPARALRRFRRGRGRARA